jgi:hypothetical protein
MSCFYEKKLWDSNLIDRILTYSVLREKLSSENIKYNFNLASFSIQTSIKIYSDRINSLTDSMRNFLFYFENKNSKQFDKNTPLNSYSKIKNSIQDTLLDRLNYSYFSNNLEFKLNTFNFNFYKSPACFKNLLKKNTENSINLSMYKYKTNLMIKLFGFIFIKKKPRQKIIKNKRLEKKVLQTLNSKKMKIRNFKVREVEIEIISELIVEIYKNKEIFAILNKIRSDLKRFNHHLTIKSNVKYFKKNQFFRKFKVWNTVFSNLYDYKIHRKAISYAYFSNFFMDIFTNKKAIKENRSFHNVLMWYFYRNHFRENVFKIPFDNENIELEIKNKISSYNLIFKFNKKFDVFVGKEKKLLYGNKIYSGFPQNQKDQYISIEKYDIEIFGLKFIAKTNSRLAFLEMKKCIFLISNCFLKDRVNFAYKSKLPLKKKFFNFLKDIIFYQIKGYSQTLYCTDISRIVLLPHNSKNV